MSKLIKNLVVFDHFQFIFNINRTRYNRFQRDDVSLQEFRSKKLIKRQFKSNFKRNLAQGRSNRISLTDTRVQNPIHQFRVVVPNDCSGDQKRSLNFLLVLQKTVKILEI